MKSTSKVVIKSNGLKAINSDDSYAVSVVLVGTLLGADLTLGYVDSEGTFFPFVNGELEEGGQYEVRHGMGVTVYVKAEGVTGSIELRVGGI